MSKKSTENRQSKLEIISRSSVETFGRKFLQFLFPKKWQTIYSILNEAEDRFRKGDFRNFGTFTQIVNAVSKNEIIELEKLWQLQAITIEHETKFREVSSSSEKPGPNYELEDKVTQSVITFCIENSINPAGTALLNLVVQQLAKLNFYSDQIDKFISPLWNWLRGPEDHFSFCRLFEIHSAPADLARFFDKLISLTNFASLINLTQEKRVIFLDKVLFELMNASHLPLRMPVRERASFLKKYIEENGVEDPYVIGDLFLYTAVMSASDNDPDNYLSKFEEVQSLSSKTPYSILEIALFLATPIYLKEEDRDELNKFVLSLTGDRRLLNLYTAIFIADRTGSVFNEVTLDKLEIIYNQFTQFAQEMDLNLSDLVEAVDRIRVKSADGYLEKISFMKHFLNHYGFLFGSNRSALAFLAALSKFDSSFASLGQNLKLRKFDANFFDIPEDYLFSVQELVQFFEEYLEFAIKHQRLESKADFLDTFKKFGGVELKEKGRLMAIAVEIDFAQVEQAQTVGDLRRFNRGSIVVSLVFHSYPELLSRVYKYRTSTGLEAVHSSGLEFADKKIVIIGKDGQVTIEETLSLGDTEQAILNELKDREVVMAFEPSMRLDKPIQVLDKSYHNEFEKPGAVSYIEGQRRFMAIVKIRNTYKIFYLQILKSGAVCSRVDQISKSLEIIQEKTGGVVEMLAAVDRLSPDAIILPGDPNLYSTEGSHYIFDAYDLTQGGFFPFIAKSV